MTWLKGTKDRSANVWKCVIERDSDINIAVFHFYNKTIIIVCNMNSILYDFYYVWNLK